MQNDLRHAAVCVQFVVSIGEVMQTPQEIITAAAAMWCSDHAEKIAEYAMKKLREKHYVIVEGVSAAYIESVGAELKPEFTPVYEALKAATSE